jgi:hypothetical protein
MGTIVEGQSDRLGLESVGDQLDLITLCRMNIADLLPEVNARSGHGEAGGELKSDYKGYGCHRSVSIKDK